MVRLMKIWAAFRGTEVMSWGVVEISLVPPDMEEANHNRVAMVAMVVAKLGISSGIALAYQQ